MSINYVKGDATEPVGEGIKFIVHICNDIGAWGAGFVLAISAKWKSPEIKYKAWAHSKLKFNLGNIQWNQVEDDIYVVNMIAQHKVGFDNGEPPIRYSALNDCLFKVGNTAQRLKASVHMPRIGCGLAGGKWEKVESIIDAALLSRNIDVTVYDLD